MTAPPANLAWRGTLDTCDGVVFAPNRSRAKWHVVRSYWDAYGRRDGSWPRVTVVRAPDLDKCPLATDPRHGFWNEQYVRDLTPGVH